MHRLTSLLSKNWHHNKHTALSFQLFPERSKIAAAWHLEMHSYQWSLLFPEWYNRIVNCTADSKPMLLGQLSSRPHQLPYNMDFLLQLSLLTTKYSPKIHWLRVLKQLPESAFSARNCNFQMHWI